MIKFTVPWGQNGINAVDGIADVVYGMPRAEIIGLLETGKIKEGFRCLQADSVLRKGHMVFINTDKTMEDYLAVADVVFEEGEFLVFNKPAGIACIMKEQTSVPTLYSIAVAYMKKADEYNMDTLCVPYICYTIPKQIGGLVIVAKSQAAFENMLHALQERRVKRFFKVIVSGTPKQADLLKQFILDNGKGKTKVLDAYIKGARPHALKYVRGNGTEDLCELEIELVTNFRNCICAQLAAAGLPVLGDIRYGSAKINKKYALRQPAVWAHKIILETGRKNNLDYLNGTKIQTETVRLPKVGIPA